MSNATHRVFFDYVTGNAPGVSKEHTVGFRIIAAETTPGAAVQDAQVAMQQILATMGAASLRAGWRVIRGRVQAAGSSFSVPFDLDAPLENFVGSSSVAGWNGSQEAIQYTWVGRSMDSGKRVRLSLYGLAFISVDTNFRITPTESPAIAGGVPDVLNGQPTIVALDNTLPMWYRYCNVQYNSYWERRIRRG